MILRKDINILNTLILCFTKGFYDELGNSRGPFVTLWPQDGHGCVYITSDFGALTTILDRCNIIPKD